MVMATATATMAQAAVGSRGVALPVLPSPEQLVNLSPNSSAVLAETRVSLDTLRQFKLAIQTGQIALPSSAPDPLPPLPPIPNPSPSSYRPPSGPLASSSKSARPNPRPSLSDQSAMAKARTVFELVNAFNDAHSAPNDANEICRAAYDQGQSAVRIQWGAQRDKGAAWIFLSGAGSGRLDDTSVESVKLYPEKAEACLMWFDAAYNIDRQRTGVHDDPASVPHQQLGRHLSELDVSLPELVNRVGPIPTLIRQPCFYCQRHFRPSDGLPLSRTGYIEPPKPPRKAVEATDPPQPDLGKDEGDTAVSPQGRWVCWHPSCEPA